MSGELDSPKTELGAAESVDLSASSARVEGAEAPVELGQVRAPSAARSEITSTTFDPDCLYKGAQLYDGTERSFEFAQGSVQTSVKDERFVMEFQGKGGEALVLVLGAAVSGSFEEAESLAASSDVANFLRSLEKDEPQLSTGSGTLSTIVSGSALANLVEASSAIERVGGLELSDTDDPQLAFAEISQPPASSASGAFSRLFRAAA